MMQETIISYYHFPITSSAQARNFGIEKIGSDIDLVFFLDDDVSIDGNCFSEVTTYMKEHTKTKGWLLHIETPRRSISFLKKLGFFLLTGTKDFDEQFVTQGGFNAMFLQQPHTKKTVQRCSGCAMFVRREVLDSWFRFPHAFMRYSLMEDVFFSYSIYKQFPWSLVYLPHAKILHHESPLRSVPPKAKILQNIVHRFLFVKTFNLSYIGYIWTIAILMWSDIITYRRISVLKRYIQWLWYIIKHGKKLDANGTNVDYNRFIFAK